MPAARDRKPFSERRTSHFIVKVTEREFEWLHDAANSLRIPYSAFIRWKLGFEELTPIKQVESCEHMHFMGPACLKCQVKRSDGR